MATGIRVKIFKVGFCVHPGFVVKSGLGLTPKKFPAVTVLIVHPDHGNVIFDVGYHDRFFCVTKSFPERFYSMVTPCTLKKGESFREQLENIGIGAVNSVILSHFHADHIAGINDFPEANIVCHRKEYQMFIRQNRLTGTRNGYLLRLMPPELRDNCSCIEKFDRDIVDIFELEGAKSGLVACDIFGDDSLFLVDLPGHTAGHVGLIIRLSNRFLFFVADACWLIDNLQGGANPHWIANLICHNRKAYFDTLNKLRTAFAIASDRVVFIPSHCSQTINTLVEKQWIF